MRGESRASGRRPEAAEAPGASFMLSVQPSPDPSIRVPGGAPACTSPAIRPRMTSATQDTAPRRAPLRRHAPSVRQVRLACGLVLFTYVTLHFLNHALGNISVAAMEEGLRFQKLIWQSVPGALALYAAVLTHMSLGFWALYERRQFRWTGFEATQLILGLTIPFLLADHVFGTRVALSLFGADKDYAQELYKFASPASGLFPGAGAAGRLGSRLHRDPLLACAQALLPAGEKPSAVGRGARADAGPARLRSGGATDSAPRRRSGVAGRDPFAGACRDGGGQRAAQCGPTRHADLSCRDARRRPPRPRRPPLAGALGRVDPPDLSRPDDPGEAGPERAGGQSPERRPARSCLRRTRALLHLPHPGSGRPRRPARARRGRAGGARPHPRRGRGAPRLPVAPRRATSPSCRCCRRM